MSEKPPLNAANIKRLADAEEHKRDLWEAVRYIIVDRRWQMPSRGTGTPSEPFPSIPSIMRILNLHGYKTIRGGDINYNTVSSLLQLYYEEWKKIPSARQMEDDLPSPRVYVLGWIRLLEDVSECCEGDYGTVKEITDDGVIASFVDRYDVKTGEPSRIDVFVRPHQMRMVPSNLHDWYADRSETDPDRIADMLDEARSQS